MRRRRSFRAHHRCFVALFVVIPVVALTACTSSSTSSSVPPSARRSSSTSPSTATASPTSTPTPTPAKLAWSKIATAPIQGDYYPPAAAVWDGEEMLVVIRQSDPKTYCREMLLAYDPTGDTWRTLSRVPTPKGCFEGADKAVWTGKELLLWGISNVAYDAASEAWRHLPPPPAGAGGPSVVVWTGRQMIGWGGGCCEQQLADGAAYTPATNSWRMLPPAPLAGRHASGVWTGTEMIIAGGEGAYANGPDRYFRDAAAYDPKTRTWRRLPPMPTPRGGGYSSLAYGAVWDGTEMLMVGGTPSSAGPPLARGAAYDPAVNRWRSIAPMRYPRSRSVAVWTGDRLVVWGGVGVNDSIPPNGETYDPVADRWSSLPMAPILARVEAVGIWTGKEVVIFGGTEARTIQSDHPRSLKDGAALRSAA